MTEEMKQDGWRKAISRERDETQSRMLMGGIGLLLAGLSLDTFRWAAVYGARFPVFVAEAIGVSVLFALAVVRLRAATTGGAVCGGMICLLVTFWTGVRTASIGRSGLTPLALLFVLTFLATRAGRQRKAKVGLAEARRGRNAAQVIANLAVAGICVSPLTGWVLSGETAGMLAAGSVVMMKTMCLAALVEATADTVSSEIGQAFGGQPVMVTSLRHVAAGTDGAVTVLGSGAGVLGGAMVAGAGAWAMHLESRAAGVALGAGICGLFFDSLVGATLERRGWLGNDLVNFASTIFAAALAGVVSRGLGL
jgi:uncharacterized protein (TIGR00297 family)